MPDITASAGSDVHDRVVFDPDKVCPNLRQASLAVSSDHCLTVVSKTVPSMVPGYFTRYVQSGGRGLGAECDKAVVVSNSTWHNSCTGGPASYNCSTNPGGAT